MILDNAPARSAELLAGGRVDAALVPIIAYQSIPGVSIIPGVCVGARERVRSVCIVTRDLELSDLTSVSLDVSSRTSVVLTKTIFREFIGREPEWKNERPDLTAMLAASDAALLIGDPALVIADGDKHTDGTILRKFDLAEVWRLFTGLGFVFAMWMTRLGSVPIDFAAARDEGVEHIDEIISNYQSEIKLDREEMRRYLSDNISYEPDAEMLEGMDLYFKLANKHGLIEDYRDLRFV